MKIMLSDEEILDYDKYADYHRRFNYGVLSESNKKLLPDLINKTTTDVPIQKKFQHIFEILLKYLSNSGIFYYYSPKACSYVSYVLSEKLHSITGVDYTEDTYQIFKKFVDVYNMSLSTESNTCKNELVKIGYDRYMQMKALYQVYNEYTNLSNTNLAWNPHNCNGMAYLVHLYNQFLNRYQSGSKNFNNVLKDFQGRMNKILSKTTTPCSGYNLAVGTPVLFEEPVVIAPQPPSEVEGLPSQGDTSDVAGKAKHTELTSLETSPVGEEVREPSHHAIGPQVSDPLRTITSLDSHKAGEAEYPHNTLEPSAKDNPFGMTGSYVSHGYHGPGRSDRSHDYLDTNSTLPEREDAFKSTHLKEQGLGIEDVSVLGKIKSTLSGIVSEVEPAPILGVSGGMGALFLLFKYTPVGSFFGRRRGLNHRIPGGFPGAYPGFPEYFDGNFGNMPINISYQAE